MFNVLTEGRETVRLNGMIKKYIFVVKNNVEICLLILNENSITCIT